MYEPQSSTCYHKGKTMGDATKTDVVNLQSEINLIKQSEGYHKKEMSRMEANMETNINKIWDEIKDLKKMLDSIDRRLYGFVAVASLIQMVAVPVITTIILRKFV